ncbi:hypothetical protein [Burkholderia sp. JKS000303]|uniref:hypothetical protein n=1 Tax=Burkholderia sp. JKS000303 TaxID=1938747 RepID=UPI000C01E317|nr:hypothetical protein [Burkholderia sp. JKS000303]PFH29216.1 hypothetical protein BX604_2988 [Burkholderia sp. JKS000303]
MMRWLLALLTCTGEYERGPSPVTAVMSAAALGFAVSAHYDARGDRPAHRNGRNA